MKVPCRKCGLVYDLSIYRPGQRLRCGCGEIMTAPEAEEKNVFKIALTLHCSNCGGALVKGRPDCPFCGALVDLTDARLTAYCSSCLSMSKEDAQFCSECGKPIVRNHGDSPEEAEEPCPRCQIKMRRRTVGEYSPLECPMCLGLFVQTENLDKMIEDQEKRVGAKSAVPGGRVVRASLVSEEVAYMKCPVCAKIMNRVNYGRISGVIIDYCREHGYWLDEGELEKIAKWVSTGGLELQREREMQEFKSGRSRASSAMMSPMLHEGSEAYGDSFGLGFHLSSGFLKLITRLFHK